MEEADGGKSKANSDTITPAQDSSASRSSNPASTASTSGPSVASSSSVTLRASASPVAPINWLVEEPQSNGFPTATDHAFPNSSRIGPYPEYERVVIQYTSGTADLMWKTTWTNDPINEKGERVNAKGDAFLQVDVAGIHEPSDVTTLPPTLHPRLLAGLSTVKGVSVRYPFESQHTVFIGLSTKSSCRIQVLKDPSRFAIDMRGG